jgi:hypothetical protein
MSTATAKGAEDAIRAADASEIAMRYLPALEPTQCMLLWLKTNKRLLLVFTCDGKSHRATPFGL